MRPRVGLRNFVSRLKHVVLPAPLGPIRAWMVPRATCRLTPLTATKPAKSLVRSSVARIVPALIDMPSRVTSGSGIVGFPAAVASQHGTDCITGNTGVQGSQGGRGVHRRKANDAGG